MDQDQTAPTVCRRGFKNISADNKFKAEDLCCIGALSVDKCEFQFIYGRDFHEMHAHQWGSNNLLTMLTVILHDLPS